MNDVNKPLRQEMIKKCEDYTNALLHEKNDVIIGPMTILFTMDKSISTMKKDEDFIRELLSKIDKLEKELLHYRTLN